MNIGDEVYFSYNSGYGIEERAGVLYDIIKAGKNINQQKYGHIVADMVAVRSIDMYVVDVQGILFLTAKPLHIPVEKRSLLVKEVPFRKHKFYDISDRLRIKKLALFLGDEIIEKKEMLFIPSWGLSFWFALDGCVEYIDEVRKSTIKNNCIVFGG